MNDKDLRKNGSGYYDPTAYKALKKIETEQELERLRMLIDTIHNICELSDFFVMERIVVRDKRTGKIWR